MDLLSKAETVGMIELGGAVIEGNGENVDNDNNILEELQEQMISEIEISDDEWNIMTRQRPDKHEVEKLIYKTLQRFDKDLFESGKEIHINVRKSLKFMN